MAPATATQRDQSIQTVTEVVTQGSATSANLYSSIDTDSVDVASALPSPASPVADKREEKQLETLTQGAADLAGYHHRQGAALASTLSDEIVKTTLAPMAQSLDAIRNGISQIVNIFTEAKTFSATSETFEKAQELLSLVSNNLAAFSAEASKFKGNHAQNAQQKVTELTAIVEELKKSPSIEPANEQSKQPEYPLGSLVVSTPYDPNLVHSFVAASDPFTEQDYNRAWAQALSEKRQQESEKRQQEFGKIVATSKDASVDLEKPRKALQGDSIVSHLEKMNPALVAAVTDAGSRLNATRNALSDTETDVDTLSGKLQDTYADYQRCYTQCADTKAAIEHLEGVQAAGDAPASEVADTPTEKRGVLARVKQFAARFTAGGTTDTAERGDGRPSRESAETDAELRDLRGELSRSETALNNLKQVFSAQKQALSDAVEYAKRLGNSIAGLKATFSGAKEALQDALRESCKDLHFTTPTNTSNPITEALLAISIPKTDRPIPGFASITEPLKDLGAAVAQDGSVSLKDPRTGQTIKIEKRSNHELDATLTVVGADGIEIVSNRIWNHNLKDVVEHFVKTGNAPVKTHKVEEWKVTEALAAPQSNSVEAAAHVGLGVSPRAAKLVSFLKEGLSQLGYQVESPGSDDNSVSNKLDITSAAHSVTALLDPKNLTWSLIGDTLREAKLTTLAAYERVAEFFSTRSKEAAGVAEESPGNSASPNSQVAEESSSGAEVESTPQATPGGKSEQSEPAAQEDSAREARHAARQGALKAWSTTEVDQVKQTGWEHKLSDVVKITVKWLQNQESFVISLIRGEEQVVRRRSNDIPRSIGFIVDEYIRRFSEPSVGQDRETASRKQSVASVEGARAEQVRTQKESQNPEQDRGPTHSR